MHDALIREVVGVEKERLPSFRQAFCLDGEAVVLDRHADQGTPVAVRTRPRESLLPSHTRNRRAHLGRDEAPTRLQVHARQVLTAVAKQHLARLAACSKGQQLVTQADAASAQPRTHVRW